MKYMLAMMVLSAALLPAIEIPLRNPQFSVQDGVIDGWRAVEPDDPSGSYESVPYKPESGMRAVRITSSQGVKYYGVVQGGFDMGGIPRPKADEALQITLRFRQKNENVANGGFVNFSFFSQNGYLVGRDTKMLPGTFDWGDVEASAIISAVPDEAKFFQVRLFLGRTTGTVYFAEPRLFMNIVKKKP